MRAIRWLLVLVLLLAIPVPADADDAERARQIVADHLEGPCPEKVMDPERGDRLLALRSMWEMTDPGMVDPGVAAIAAVLPGVECRVHRLELIESLGRMPSRASAELLIPMLHDPDVTIRRQALAGLRLHASRIRRSGVVNVPKGAEFPPKVDGLVPYLVEAAHDDEPGIRGLALFALTDSRDPAAVTELRRALEDEDFGVRFGAACLLTEFDDASGLPVLREALDILAHPSEHDGDRPSLNLYLNGEHLFVSFERITGVSLGAIAPNPLIMSSMGAAEERRKDYGRLIEAWDAWWREHDEKE